MSFESSVKIGTKIFLSFLLALGQIDFGRLCTLLTGYSFTKTLMAQGDKMLCCKEVCLQACVAPAYDEV